MLKSISTITTLNSQKSKNKCSNKSYFDFREMENDHEDDMFTVCVSELVQQTRDFDLIVGRLEPDGCRIPGVLDLFKGVRTSTQEIIRFIALDCEVKGNLEDAVHLFDLANVSFFSSIIWEVR